jgi:hypothetical protein
MSAADRIRAAVLCVVDGRDLDEAHCRIDHVGPPYGFALLVEGVTVATCDHPAPLSTYAFNNGAEGVTHNYDLAKAET